jgi:hypothetical protein
MLWDGPRRGGVVQSRGNRTRGKAEVVCDGFEGHSRFGAKGLLLPRRLGHLWASSESTKTIIASSISFTHRGSGGLLGSSIRFSRLLGWVRMPKRPLLVWGMPRLSIGTPHHPYSKCHRDLERYGHVPNRTRPWPSPTAARHRGRRIALFSLRKSLFPLDKLLGIGLYSSP